MKDDDIVTVDKAYGHALKRNDLNDTGSTSLALVSTATAGWAWRGDSPVLWPTTTDTTTPLYALVNWGRWVVPCDNCTGAQVASRDDPTFFCTDCLNATFPAQWRTVTFPDSATADQIEAVLQRRPDPRTRNWLVGQTVNDLLAENAAHGLT